MPRQVATYEDVKQAAVTLISRGDPPTLERMRAIIGHGSYSTIRTHYQNFQKELKQQPKALWPAAVPESLLSVVETLWHTAMETAEVRFQKLREQAQNAIQQAQQQAATATETTTTQQAKLDQLSHQLAALTEQLQLTEKTLAVAEDRLATRTAALDELQQRETGLRQQLAAAEANATQYQQQAEKLTTTLERKVSALAETTEISRQREQTLKDTQRDYAVAQKHWDKEKMALEKQLAATEKQVDKTAQQQHRVEQQLQMAERKRAEAEREAQVLERQLDTLALRLAQGHTSSPSTGASEKTTPRKPKRSNRPRQKNNK